MNKQNATLNYGLVLLAAGASKRLGKPKQLLPYQGKTLLSHALQTAAESRVSPVVLVLGANADLLKLHVENDNVEIVANANWQTGMASSIQCGLQQVLATAPNTNAVIIMVCDQPFITTQLLTDLMMKYEASGKPIAASSYKGIPGTPALFDKTIFEELMKLTGDTGAKKIMQSHRARIATVEFILGEIDIDTDEDYDKLVNGG